MDWFSLDQQWKDKDTVKLYKSSLKIHEAIIGKSRVYNVGFKLISVNFSYILETNRLTSGLELLFITF